ncbi:mechanosensitive ion channel family protein [Burkholderia territorii]|uniref:mechanosensitive ion channel family protein n=1 Tax=Burkholderia territorii TaxID=1503055 RepID=UPI0009C16DD0|nr:mechanosensitive ion channel domain-containing protein [Burkholderia territorii]
MGPSARRAVALAWATACLWIASVVTVLALPGVAAAAASDKAASTPTPAELRFSGHAIVVFRGDVAGAPPAARAARAHATLAALPETALTMPVETADATLSGTTGTMFRLGDHILFVVTRDDVDAASDETMEHLVATVRTNLAAALAARRAMLHWPNLLRGALFSIAATFVLAGVIAIVLKMRTLLQARLQRTLEEGLLGRTSKRFDWSGSAVQLARQLVQLIAAFLIGLAMYAWLIFVLDRFPATEQEGERLSVFLLDLGGQIGMAVIDAVPGIVTVVVIFLLTRAMQGFVANLFRAIQSGGLTVPGVHQDTIGATRRLVAIGIWVLGITFAYPYIPGSQSEVFKGLSVLLGFMVTLGSSGVVTQLMGGIVVVYARALRKGDFVKIGDITGVVLAIDALSVKIATVRNEEVTIPNAVVVNTAVVNYTTRFSGRQASVSASVTIGYDAPWRQVRAMLEEAARRTPYVPAEPVPLVLQTSLSDYYIEYTLVAPIDRPELHPRVQSDLHAHIIDVFNEHGVQIMSPHFRAQPDQAVVVPQAEWYRAPASPDPERNRSTPGGAA